jgi:type IV secretion system protein VirB5
MTMGHTDPPHSDYQSVFLNMRVQWNELVASHIQRENTWRITAWMALGVALVCAGGLVYCGTQNKLVPYVVQVDKLGSAVAVQRAGQAAPVDSRIIRAQLGAWIESVRSIYQDAGAERVNLKSAYAMIRHSDGAYRTLNDYFIQHDPFQLAQSQGVSVEISTVQPISEKTWQVQWRETVHSPKGDELSVTPMQANLTVSISPPTDEATLLVNPMGVYITQFNWSPRL